MLSDEAFRRLLNDYDRSWDGYRKVRKGVKKRIRRRMAAIGCRDAAAYLELIASCPDEWRVCERLLLVTISRFFRDRSLWRYLEERLLPRLIERFPAPLRLWSAGCACGEEAYSLAIVWASLPAAPPLDLLATDGQSVCLERALTGVYSWSSLREVPPRLAARYFLSRKGGRQFTVRQGRLPAIRWRRHDLLDPPPSGPFHMIFLRNNLLTYHRGVVLQAALEKILTELRPGGYLVVGSHEKPPPLPLPLRRDPHCPWVFKKGG